MELTYYQRHKESLKEYQKQYYSVPENRERLKAYQKKYYAIPENKEKKKKTRQKYISVQENRERHLEAMRICNRRAYYYKTKHKTENNEELKELREYLHKQLLSQRLEWC
jgi:hypothetical protein